MTNRLARFGIQGGRRVVLSGDSLALASAEPEPLSPTSFAVRALARLGWGDISTKIQHGELLAVADVARLLLEAPLAVLLKLVELRSRGGDLRAVTPMLFLDLSSWPEESGIFSNVERVLGYLEDSRVEVLLEGLTLQKLRSGLAQELRRLSHMRQGVVLIGPALEQLVDWVRHAKNADTQGMTLPELVTELRQANIGRLKASRDLRLLRQVPSFGLGASVCTPLDRFAQSDSLAHELIRLRDLCQAGITIDVWFPGFSHRLSSAGRDCSVTDLQVLRALCVGTLLLPEATYRRASSQYLSLDGMRFARLCGANDFGFGAVDALSSARLNLLPYTMLRSAGGGSL